MSKLVEMIKRHEGVKSKVYLCSAGYETIGVGRNISESGLGLSDDEIDYLLESYKTLTSGSADSTRLGAMRWSIFVLILVLPNCVDLLTL